MRPNAMRRHLGLSRAVLALVTLAFVVPAIARADTVTNMSFAVLVPAKQVAASAPAAAPPQGEPSIWSGEKPPL